MAWRAAGLLAAALAGLLAPDAVAGPSWDQGAASFVESVVTLPQSPLPGPMDWPFRARLDQPVGGYDHDILGGIPHWSRLAVVAQPCAGCGAGPAVYAVTLPGDMIFEDVMPRLWDVTGDGRAEVVLVETSLTRGARLAVWGFGDGQRGLTRLAATGFIGRPQRWLAPVGAGDFDGDGQMEIAYIDRPHLQRDLVVLRLEGGTLREVARAPGFTAHRIGDTAITSAVRRCVDGVDEIVLPDGTWSRLMAVRWRNGSLQARDLGAMSDRQMQAAVAGACG